MPDERLDSIRQGIGAPAESPEGQSAAEERRRLAAEGPEIGGAMGGTSDADSPGDEAQANAARFAGSDDAGGDDLRERLDERSRILRETREAGERAEGGGDPDEDDIARDADGDR